MSFDSTPFSPAAPEASLSVTAASARVSLAINPGKTSPSSATVLLTNEGPADAHVKLGDGTVAATTADRRIPAGNQTVIRCGDPAFTHVAAVTDSGVATLRAQYGGGVAPSVALVGPGQGYGFNAAVQPTVTASVAYSVGAIMGGLLQFDAAATPGGTVIAQQFIFRFKSAVTPSLAVVLFNAPPSATTTTDASPYSLAAADLDKVLCVLPVSALGGYTYSHGTPKTIQLNGQALALQTAAGSRAVYALVIVLSGVTLASNSDFQMAVLGIAG